MKIRITTKNGYYELWPTKFWFQHPIKTFRYFKTGGHNKNEADIDAAVKKQVAKITLAGMPELTLKQQDYITRELQGSDGKKEA